MCSPVFGSSNITGAQSTTLPAENTPFRISKAIDQLCQDHFQKLSTYHICTRITKLLLQPLALVIIFQQLIIMMSVSFPSSSGVHVSSTVASTRGQVLVGGSGSIFNISPSRADNHTATDPSISNPYTCSTCSVTNYSYNSCIPLEVKFFFTTRGQPFYAQV